VIDDRNFHGSGTIAVPGVVEDWWTTLMIASSAADLLRYPASAAAYLQDGLPPNAQWGIKSKTIPNHLSALARMLGHIRLGQNQVLGQRDLASSLRAAWWSVWT